jgi:hypothetical protein
MASKVPVAAARSAAEKVEVAVSVAEGRVSGVEVDVEVGELTIGENVPVGWAVNVCTTAVFSMASAVPALSTIGGAGGAGAGVNGRQAAVRRIKATEKTVLCIQPSSRL